MLKKVYPQVYSQMRVVSAFRMWLCRKRHGVQTRDIKTHRYEMNAHCHHFVCLKCRTESMNLIYNSQ